jgi:hypothetical protein
MATEIFRFMTIRPPQEVDSATAIKNSVNLNTFRSVFIESLVQQRKLGSRDGIERVIQEYRKLHDSDFIDSRKKVDGSFLSLYQSLAGLGEEAFFQVARTSFISIFHVEPNAFIQEDDFNEVFVKITNSIVIAAIDQIVAPKVRSLLVGLAQTLGLIQKLAAWPENQVYSIEDFRSQIIVLPEGIFPLPSVKQDSSQLLQAEKERLDKIAKNRAQLLELAKELTTNRDAINDLMTTFEKSIDQSKSPQSNSIDGSVLSNGDLARRGFVLSDKAVNSLSDETKAILKKIGLDVSNVDVAMATSLIEKQSSELSNQLYASRSSMKYMVKIGNNLIPSDVLLGDMPIDPGDSTTEPGVPGMCPPVPSVNEADEVTVPPSNTHGEARVLGIADLMIVEQELPVMN